MLEQEASQVSNTVAGVHHELQRVLNTLSIGMMLLNVNGEVILTNSAAKSIIGSRNWLHIADGRLRVQGSSDGDIETRIRLAVEQRSAEEDTRVFLQGEDLTDALLLAFTSMGSAESVSYTHLTLPTSLRV